MDRLKHGRNYINFKSNILRDRYNNIRVMKEIITIVNNTQQEEYNFVVWEERRLSQARRTSM